MLIKTLIWNNYFYWKIFESNLTLEGQIWIIIILKRLIQMTWCLHIHVTGKGFENMTSNYRFKNKIITDLWYWWRKVIAPDQWV